MLNIDEHSAKSYTSCNKGVYSLVAYQLREILQKNKGAAKTQSFKILKSKPIIDKIDKVIAQHYGFPEEKLDFIINCNIKYRMGKKLDAYATGILGRKGGAIT